VNQEKRETTLFFGFQKRRTGKLSVSPYYLRAIALFVRTLGKSFNGVSYNYKPFYSKTNSKVLQGRNLCYSAIFVPLSPTTKLQDNPLLAIRDCFFNMAVTLRIKRPSPSFVT
jgi:hypothetical protein